MMRCSKEHSVRDIMPAVLYMFVTLVLVVFVQSARAASVTGLVRDADGPVAGATVRMKATAKASITDSDGRFVLDGLEQNEPVILTAWARGYYIGGGDKGYLPGASNIEIVLTRHSDRDNPDYKWLSAFANAGYAGSGEGNNCENCHADPNNPQAQLPFSEWQGDAHALSAGNLRFITMYNGTDSAGNQSPPTQYFHSRDYG